MAIKAGRDDDVMAEINITPFTDVLLVLLIIFMVMAAAITRTGFNINLPKVASQEEATPSEIVISVTMAGDVYLGANKTTIDQLYPELAAMAQRKNTSRVIIKADAECTYGKVMQVMDAAKSAGLNSIALAMERK